MKDLAKIEAPGSVSRNFPPAVKKESHLFYYAARNHLHNSICNALLPVALERPCPARTQMKSSFLRNFLLECMKPRLMQSLIANVSRS